MVLDDLRKTKVRFLMLFLTSVYLIGSYFCFDNPSVLEAQMEDVLNISKPEWALFSTVYSTPNIVLPLFGGIMLDKLGIR